MANIKHEPEALLPVLLHYDLPQPISVSLIRAGFNHNYLIDAGDQKYVCRLYLNDKYYIQSADDFRFELDMLRFLLAHDIPVACPVKNKTGEDLTLCQVGNESRCMALFEFAAGKDLDEEDVDNDGAALLGQLLAKMHGVMDTFDSVHTRYHLDRTYLLDEPLKQLRAYMQQRNMGDMAFFDATAEKLDELIQSYPKAGPAYGYIHADLNSSNILYDAKKGFTLLDFDHSGFGWRFYDLAIFYEALPDAQWKTCLGAYEAVRPLADWEHEALLYGPVFSSLWDMGDILNMMTAWAREPSDKYMNECVETLQELVGKVSKMG